MPKTGFIVVYDDEQGLCVPYGWDDECDGALCSDGKTAAWFESRDDARKAIRISTRYAMLCKAQGKPENTDFTETLKFVKVVPLVARPERE